MGPRPLPYPFDRRPDRGEDRSVCVRSGCRRDPGLLPRPMCPRDLTTDGGPHRRTRTLKTRLAPSGRPRAPTPTYPTRPVTGSSKRTLGPPPPETRHSGVPGRPTPDPVGPQGPPRNTETPVFSSTSPPPVSSASDPSPSTLGPAFESEVKPPVGCTRITGLPSSWCLDLRFDRVDPGSPMGWS